MKKPIEIFSFIFAILISGIFTYNNITYLNNLSLNFNYLKKLLSFILMVLVIYYFSKNIIETSIIYFNKNILPKIKEKFSNTRGKFEIIISFIAVIFVLYNMVPSVIDYGKNIISIIIMIIFLISFTSSIFSNFEILISILFSLLPTIILVKYFEINIVFSFPIFVFVLFIINISLGQIFENKFNNIFDN